jgi:hypothetical protein
MSSDGNDEAIHGIELDLQRIEKEDGDLESYCVDLADRDPALFLMLVAKHCHEECREALMDVCRDRPELLVTLH